MADIRLAKPAAGTSQNVVCTPEARFVFEFPTDEATLSRNGDNLVITFEDGSTLQLENFYTAYSSENMPSFSVDGAEISGQDFFTAMNEPDLMPAAGPAGNAGNQSNGNRFHDYVNADLLDGLDRLGGLDIGWPGSDVNPETDGAATSGDYIPEEIVPGITFVSITATDTVEGTDSIVFDIQLSQAPYKGTSAVVQVKVGEQIYDVILDADGHGVLTIANPNGEDVYKDGSSITAEVVGVIGGNYEAVEAGQSATANITDTVDTTTVKLEATAVADGQYSLTVTVDNAPKSDLELKLSNGETITIKAGATVATQSYDYKPGQDMDISVTGVVGQTDKNKDGKIDYDEAGEGFYETLDFSGAETSTSYDAAKIVVKAEGGTEDPNQNDWKFTFELQDKDGNPVAAASDITVTYTDPFGQEQTITIKKGESSAEVSIDSKNTEDAFKEAPTAGEVEITGISDSNIEGVNNSDSANITDTVDTTTVKLEATAVADGQYSLTVTVDNAPKSDLELKLSNGETITIKAGATVATQSYDYKPGQDMDISVTGVDGQTDTDGDRTISYDEAGEGFYETLDFGDATASIDVPPVAEDDTLYVNKSDHFETTVTISSEGAGKVYIKGSVLDDKMSTQGDVIAGDAGNNNKVDENPELANETTDDFFSRFFEVNGNGTTFDQLEKDGLLYIIEGTDKEIWQQLETLDGSEKIIVLRPNDGTLELNGKVDLDVNGMPIIIDGDVSSTASSVNINGFVYVRGDYEGKGNVTISGGLAVEGNLDLGSSIHVGDFTDGEHGGKTEITVGSEVAIEIDFEKDLLNDDYDPDNNMTKNDQFYNELYESITTPEGYKKEPVYGDDGTITGVKFTPYKIDTDGDGQGDIYNYDLTFTYTITDNDGLSDTATVTVNIVDDIQGTSHEDTVVAGDTSELVISDSSGTGGLNVPGQNYNVCVVMDSSGSIEDNGGISAVKTAITGLAKELSVFDGEVNFAIVDFDSGSRLIEFSGPLSNLIQIGSDGKPDLDGNGEVQFKSEFSEALDSITEGGGTNYEAGLNSAKAWFDSQAEEGKGVEAGYTNYTFFVTDGKPTASWADTIQLEETRTVTIKDVNGEEWTENGVTYRIETHRGMFTTQKLQVKNESNEWITVDTTSYGLMGGHRYQVNESVEYHIHIPLNIPQGEGPGYEWTVDGVTYRLVEGNNISDSQNDYSSNYLDVVQVMKDGTEYKLGTIAWNNGDKGSDPDDIDSTEGKGSVESLKKVSEIFAIGIGSDIGNLNDYASDASHVIQIGNTDELLNAFISGIQNITNAIPSSDIVFGGKGNDILFGDSGVDNLAATIAEKLGIDLAELTSAQMMEYINSYPEEFDVSYRDKEINGELVVFDKADILVGGSGDDIIYGQGGDDLLFGDGDFSTLDQMVEFVDIQTEGKNNADLVSELTQGIRNKVDDFAEHVEALESISDGNDILFGGEGDDVLLGLGGDDMLLGDKGDDLLFGGSGDDYLDGGEGRDTMYAGSGDDIVVYDSSDYLIDGGDGIDVLLVDATELGGRNIEELLGDGHSKDGDKTLVNGFEVVITGDNIDELGLTSLSDLGITIKNDEVSLGDQWSRQDDGSYTGRFENASGEDITLTMHVDTSIQDMVDQAAQNIANSNG